MEDNRTNRLSRFSSTFQNILKSKTVVDKSPLILAVFEDQERPMVLCTAPRRFGKTANLWMMQHFLEMEIDENGKEITKNLEEKDNYKLFSSAGLKVMENEEFVKTHFGQYPIINISFLCTHNVESASDAVKVCRTKISYAFMQHRYLYKSTLSPLENGQKKVCEKWCDESAYKGIPDEDVIKGLADLARYLYKHNFGSIFCKKFPGARTPQTPRCPPVRKNHEPPLIITSTFSQAGFFFGNEIATDDNTKADVILFSDKSGIVIELKYGDQKTAEDAFKQILNKHYYKIFGTEKHDISLTLLMGIHVNPVNEAYVMCFQRKDIGNVQNVLFNLQQPLLEKRIEMGVKAPPHAPSYLDTCLRNSKSYKRKDESFINDCCKKAAVY